ncbi:MAG: mannose-1-phosphate guanylyltransferase [Chloroflexi bacterium]|nr:mannose-1-phosphate guanylyltransferase [Chloroflexota bacterium]
MPQNKKTNSIYALILAGGTGTRLWPRSRKMRPKQLLPLISSRTMLQETVDRILPLIHADHVFIVTNAGYTKETRQQLPNVPPENVIGEIEGHGTAPSIGLGGLYIDKLDPDAIMISLHADHFIAHPADFRRALANAAQVAREGYLVTLGIKPSHPETGYGYIHRGELVEQAGDQPVYRVAQFLEKPDAATAARFVESGEYYWNSGIFAWKLTTLWEEYDHYQSKLCAQLRTIAKDLGTRKEKSTLKRVWDKIANETIDVGIMEKSQRVVTLPIDVGWSDVGSWATLLDLLPANRENNVVVGEHIGVDTTSTLVYSPNRLIATVGLRDMIVVDAGDAILVCPKDRAQQVKHLVDALKKNNKHKYL